MKPALTKKQSLLDCIEKQETWTNKYKLANWNTSKTQEVYRTKLAKRCTLWFWYRINLVQHTVELKSKLSHTQLYTITTSTPLSLSHTHRHSYTNVKIESNSQATQMYCPYPKTKRKHSQSGSVRTKDVTASKTITKTNIWDKHKQKSFFAEDPQCYYHENINKHR